MKSLPIGFEFDFADEAKEVFAMLQQRQPLPVEQEVYSREHLLIDEVVSMYFGFAGHAESIRQDLIQKVRFRSTRSRR